MSGPGTAPRRTSDVDDAGPAAVTRTGARAATGVIRAADGQSVPPSVRNAAAWSWRLLLIGAALAVLLWLLERAQGRRRPDRGGAAADGPARAVRRLAPAPDADAAGGGGRGRARRARRRSSRACSRSPAGRSSRASASCGTRRAQGIDKLTDLARRGPAAADHHGHLGVAGQAPGVAQRRQLGARLGRAARDDDGRPRRRRRADRAVLHVLLPARRPHHLGVGRRAAPARLPRARPPGRPARARHARRLHAHADPRRGRRRRRHRASAPRSCRSRSRCRSPCSCSSGRSSRSSARWSRARSRSSSRSSSNGPASAHLDAGRRAARAAARGPRAAAVPHGSRGVAAPGRRAAVGRRGLVRRRDRRRAVRGAHRRDPEHRDALPARPRQVPAAGHRRPRPRARARAPGARPGHRAGGRGDVRAGGHAGRGRGGRRRAAGRRGHGRRRRRRAGTPDDRPRRRPGRGGRCSRASRTARPCS